MSKTINFFHFAYMQEFRSSVGGLKLGEPLCIRLLVSKEYSQHISTINLVLTKDGEEAVAYKMHASANSPLSPIPYPVISPTDLSEKHASDSSSLLDLKNSIPPSFGIFFETKLDITTNGLYFYHFEVAFLDGSTLRIGRDRFYAALERGIDEWELTVFSEPTPVTTLNNINEKASKCKSQSAALANDEVHSAARTCNEEASTNHVNQSPAFNGCKSDRADIIYQIFTDRFCIGGERNKTKSYAKYREDWGGVPDYGAGGERITNTDFFGGNLKGITSKLDYLKSLGVTLIYLNPIFEARSSHKYDTGNYLKIDPDFGTEADFNELIAKANALGIGIILDGVFSHTGDDSIYFNKYGNYDSVGAYSSTDSPYYEWYSFDSFPDKYASWWGIDTLPNVTENNKHYTEFICGQEGVLRHWIRKGVSGWRLDVADELPDEFLDRVRYAVKRESPSAIIIGEVWENAATKISYEKRKRYFSSCQLDSVTNYPLKNAIICFVARGDSSELASVCLELISTYPPHVLNRLMNILGTHDTERIRTVFGTHNATVSRTDRAYSRDLKPELSLKRVMLSAAIQFTIFGNPCIYYGDEAGLEGFEDPFNRRCYPWGQENTSLIDFYKTLGRIRRENSRLFNLGKTDVLLSAEGVFIFSRSLQNEKIIVVANASSSDYTFSPSSFFSPALTEPDTLVATNSEQPAKAGSATNQITDEQPAKTGSATNLITDEQPAKAGSVTNLITDEQPAKAGSVINLIANEQPAKAGSVINLIANEPFSGTVPALSAVILKLI